MTQIKNSVAFVTGAASGIGRALAIALAQRGAKTIVITDVNEIGLLETKNLVSRQQVNVISHLLDVSDRESFQQQIEATVEQEGGIDLLFNNAGVTLGDTVDHISYDDFNWVMGINFWGVVHGTKAVLPYMLKRGTGHIINVSSLFGFVGVGASSAYCTSKFAVRGFTETLIHELHGTNVNVTTVHPGGIKTNIAANARSGRDVSKEEITAGAQQFEKIAFTTSEKAADIILKGVARNKKRLYVGIDAHIIARLANFCPPLYYWILGRMGQQSREYYNSL